jgi:hypothetical protein
MHDDPALCSQAIPKRDLHVIREREKRWHLVFFWSIALLGAILRLYALGRIPAGLNGDEAEEGVEVLSLLATGTDRWGDAFPVFFPHVGSGMNPLNTYLTLPIFYLLGPSVFSLRLVSAVLGALTPVTTYLFARMNFGRSVGLLAMFLVAFLPWHLMESRWGIEWSMLPFWFSLGMVTVSQALRAESSGFWRVVALLPWAIGIYSYFAATIPIAAISLLTAISFRRTVLVHWRTWTLGLLLAVIVDVPIILFICVNFLHLTFIARLDLPFSVPILPVSRFSEIKDPFVPQLIKNLVFLIDGYRDGRVWNQSPDFLPLTGVAPLMTVAATIALLFAAVRDRKPSFLLNILLVAVIFILVVRLNLNRFNWFYIPSIIGCSALLLQIHVSLNDRLLKRTLAISGGLYIGLFLLMFYPYYFRQYNTDILAADVTLDSGFRVGLGEALRDAVRLAGPGEPIYVEAGASHPYLYVIFYGLADIRSFQTTRHMRTAPDGLYHVSGFDRFLFAPDAPPPETTYTFVTRIEHEPCDHPVGLVRGPVWAVGHCVVGGARNSSHAEAN